MKRICLQAGHENCQYNSILALRRSTGAPNEMTFNVDIRNKVAEELRKRGFTVATTDANANDDKNITRVDWDLFLSIHYDADIYQSGGGFLDFPEPSTDSATQESQRIVAEISSEYFKTTKIAEKPLRRNAKTKFYYMWKFLTPKTPCAIIECGVGMHIPDDWQTLHFNRPVVVEGIVRGICKSFGVAYENTPSDCDEIRKQNINMLDKIVSLSRENDQLKSDLAAKIKACQVMTDTIKSKTMALQLETQTRIAEFLSLLNKY